MYIYRVHVCSMYFFTIRRFSPPKSYVNVHQYNERSVYIICDSFIFGHGNNSFVYN